MPRNAKAIGHVLSIPREMIRPFPGQPRKYFDRAKLEELSRSIKAVGQVVPVLVLELNGENTSRHAYELVDGQRRWHACGMAGVDDMLATLHDPTKDQYTTSVVSNFGRAAHTPLEIAHAVQHFREVKRMEMTQIAEVFGCSLPTVYMYYRLLKLIPEVQEMMNPELPEDVQINFSVAVQIADAPPYEQLALAQQIVKEGMKSQQARNFIRARGATAGFKVGVRTRGGADEVRNLKRFADRVTVSLEAYTALTNDQIQRMADSQKTANWVKLRKQLTKNANDLQKLLTRLPKEPAALV